MNRTHSPLLSPSNNAYKQFMDMAKMYSREKKEDGRKYSKSPKQNDQNQRGERKVETEMYRQLQERYRELEVKYRELLDQTKQRGVQHEQLKSEIKKYHKYHQRDSLEIQRLRCIIGLIKRRSVSIQVEEDQLDSSGPRGSRLNKFDQSTDDEIKLKNSSEKLNSRQRLSPYKLLSPKEEVSWQTLNRDASQGGIYLKNKNKYNVNQVEKEKPAPTIKFSREMRESITSNKKLSNSPYSRLRFVPAANYK